MMTTQKLTWGQKGTDERDGKKDFFSRKIYIIVIEPFPQLQWSKVV